MSGDIEASIDGGSIPPPWSSRFVGWLLRLVGIFGAGDDGSVQPMQLVVFELGDMEPIVGMYVKLTITSSPYTLLCRRAVRDTLDIT